MRIRRSCNRTLVSLIVALFMAVTPASATTGKWVSGYYVGYMASSYPPSAIDFSSLTHVMVFAVLPHIDGTLDTTLFIDSTNGPKIAQDVATRAHAAGKKAILTVGGSGTEAAFAGATGSQYLTTFVKNIINVVNAWGFDGVDIDWEPLPQSDYVAFLNLMSSLRSAKAGITLTTDVGWQNVNFPMSSTDQNFYLQSSILVDQMNVMTYGMADNWGGWISWHSSALFGQAPNHPSSVSSSAQAYVSAGVPAWKVGIGIGAYGSCWNGPTTGPMQALNTSRVVADDNAMSFANIKNLYYKSSAYLYDTTAQAPYLSFGAATGPNGCTFVSYEDETSVAAKGTFAQQSGIGGAIVWQLNEAYNPSASDPSSFLHAVGIAFLGTAATSPIAPTSPTGGDSTPPTAAIASPLNNAIVPRKSVTSISVTASDNVGVAKIEVYVSNSLLCTITALPTACGWNIPAAPNKSYVLQAKAYDAAGNVGLSSPVTVVAR